MILNATGGGRSGAVLTVSGVAGSTITAAKDGKSFSRTADRSGTAVFKGLESGEWTLTMTSGGETAARTITITADYSITITFFSATINVTYPAGSTCKAVHTDGTELTAPDTSGTWSCIVPSAGTWTVTATDGTNTKSESVEITSEGQSESVTLRYMDYIFKRYEGFVDGFSITPIYNSYGFEITSDSIVWGTSLGIGNQIWVTDKVDLSPYKILYVTCKCFGRYTSSYQITFGVGEDKPTGESSPGTFIASITGYNEEETTYEVNVEAVNSMVYIKFSANAVTGEIYDIWLE